MPWWRIWRRKSSSLPDARDAQTIRLSRESSRGAGDRSAATACAATDPRITARPRSLVPSARNRNRPSMPAKPDGLVSTSGEKRCAALGSRQRRDQRHRVIGQCRGAHRVAAEFGAVAAGETAEAGRIGRGIRGRPAAPGWRTRADCPTGRCRAAGCFSDWPPAAVSASATCTHGVAVVGDEQRIGRTAAPAPRCAPARRGRRRIFRTRRCVRSCGRPPA